jgi:hypothetical protein
VRYKTWLRTGNLYYTLTYRGKNLLTLGASSDGVFDHYSYPYPRVRKFLCADIMVQDLHLRGGIEKSPSEQKAAPLKAALMHERF